MGVLVGLLLAAAVAGAWTARWLFRQQRTTQLRNQAQLHVIEGQLAAFRAALRLQVAEHVTRQRMRDAYRDDPFKNSTEHEEYRPS
jgi:hypothetical protein